MSETRSLDELLSPQQLADEIPGGSVRTIERWRTNGTGPPFVKFGRRILYRRGDYREWLQRQTFTHTAAVRRKPRG